LNPRPQRPERCALTKLRYFPSGVSPFPTLSPAGTLADSTPTDSRATRRVLSHPPGSEPVSYLPDRVRIVQRDEIRVGAEYAFRNMPRRREKFERVRVLGAARGKWRVEWIEPNPGLTDYVPSAKLIVPWQEQGKFLRDEKHQEALVAHSSRSWPGSEHPLERAVDDVLTSTGESFMFDHAGVVTAGPDVIERVAVRAKMTLAESPYAYTDRHGQRHLPFVAAAQLAQNFAAVEPRTVLLHVDVEQRTWEVRAVQPGASHLAPMVERYRAAWALVRQWAGFNEALAQRDAEIERLCRLLLDIEYELRHGGHDELARKMRRKLLGA
jgi:hypothetical protein